MSVEALPEEEPLVSARGRPRGLGLEPIPRIRPRVPRSVSRSSAADWIAAGRDHWNLTIQGFVPAEYDANARV